MTAKGTNEQLDKVTDFVQDQEITDEQAKKAMASLKSANKR